MNVFIYSADDNIIKHFNTLLSENPGRIFSYNSLSELEKSLESLQNKAEAVVLIFHLGSEAELTALQQRFKTILNTLAVTNTPEPQQGVRLLTSNVRGYANTYIDSRKLETAINVIQQGEIWLGNALVEYLLKLNQAPMNRRADDHNPSGTINASVFEKLSEREQQIAQKILAGLQNKLIAAELDITERTVKAHLTTIFKKLKVRNRLELTLILQQADRRESRERRKIS